MIKFVEIIQFTVHEMCIYGFFSCDSHIFCFYQLFFTIFVLNVGVEDIDAGSKLSYHDDSELNNLVVVTQADFLGALARLSPSLTHNEVLSYEKMKSIMR